MGRALSILMALVIAGCSCAAASASAVTSDQLEGVTLRDDLQRNDPASGFSSSGMGAGKWSTPSYIASRGAAYNSGGRLGYGSPEGWSAAYWNAEKFKDNGNGVAVKATLNSKLGSGELVALWLNQPNPTGSAAGYLLQIIGVNSSGGTGRFFRVSGGVAELLKEGPAITSTGTTYAIAEKQGEVSAWAKFGGSFFSPPGYQFQDPAPFKEGYAGLQIAGTSPSLANFSAGALPPARPSVTASAPVSPSTGTAPSIIGSAESGTTVNLFTNGSCSGKAIASGTAAAFNSSGVVVSVEKDTTTTFYASVTNSESVASACSSSGLTYVNDSTPPAKPTLGWTDPTSPGANTAIHIGGSAEAGSTVRLYKGTTCSGEVLVSGAASALASPGLALSVGKGSTTTFSATATDAAGNVSPCSSSITYVETEAILFEAQHLGDFTSIFRCLPERTTEVVDPLGSAGTVMDFTVLDTDVLENKACTGTEPNNDPRAQGLSSEFVKAGDEFWLRTKFLIPKSFPEWPKLSGEFITLISLFGAPNTGSSPWRIEVRGNQFVYERNATYNNETIHDKEAPWVAPLEKGTWVELMTHERFDEKGWLEMWFNGSPVKFFGETFKLEMATRDSSNNAGNNSFRIGQYRKAGMIKEAASIYFQFIKVGSTKASVGG
ncbi:MAG TPA: heparin lyase I family protein [Solirubrobacterales bacterium]|nr:heparin lyase I family protein [Solirubrobacterales bacterium]